MNRLLLESATLLLAAGMAMAQTTAPGNTATSATPGGTNGSTMPPSMTPPPATPPADQAPGGSAGAPAPQNGVNPSDKAAASGNENQAVATTSANADQPAFGANSFTKAEARHRIARHGYRHVAALHKDHNGVWRGTAQKNGTTVNVWLDYKGNVGEQS